MVIYHYSINTNLSIESLLLPYRMFLFTILRKCFFFMVPFKQGTFHKDKRCITPGNYKHVPPITFLNVEKSNRIGFIRFSLIALDLKCSIYTANMNFTKLCTQCKCGDGRICSFLCKFGHRYHCIACKALQISSR